MGNTRLNCLDSGDRGPGRLLLEALLSLALVLVAACDRSVTAPPPAPSKPDLIYYDWADDMPLAVFDAFTAEYGIKVKYLTFASGEEAVANLRAGKTYDVVAVESQDVPALVAAGLLAQIDYRNVPNFKNVSADFRDLLFDPGNTYTAPFNWGTIGLLVRTDLVNKPVTAWADLWDPSLAGKIVIWNQQRYLTGIALKSLGYSVNSEDPEQLAAALAHLGQLAPEVRILDYDTAVLDKLLASGEAALVYGFSGDMERLRDKHPAVQYILPEEGVLLWGDHFAIPANSSNKRAAELFIDFLMRPEIIAQFVNEIHYAVPNDAAIPLIKPEVLRDPAIYPPKALLEKAEILLPLSPQGAKLHADIWHRFLRNR